MKKEEFINIIDDIKPDIHMKNRLKAKVVSGVSYTKQKRISKLVTVVCLAVIIVLCTGFVGKRPATVPDNPTQDSTQNIVPDVMSGFIVLASAAENEKHTAFPRELKSFLENK